MRPNNCDFGARSKDPSANPTIATGLEGRPFDTDSIQNRPGSNCRIRPSEQHMPLSSAMSPCICPGDTDFLGLRLVVHGVPLLSLLGRVRHSPLALSKLLRLANSSVRHGGCWDEDGVGGCRVGGLGVGG